MNPVERAMADAAMYAKANEAAAYDEGYDKGMDKGRDERDREIIQNMLNDNLSFETISKYTGLSSERITEIKSTL